MIDMNKFLRKSVARHKHLCPRQVLGVRMGILAAKNLEFELPQTKRRLLTMVETDGCFADGVEVTTGCTVGHRTLRVQDFGKVAAVFIDTKTKESFRIAPQWNVRQIADSYGAEGKNRWERQLLGYQRMPDSELFTMEWVELTMPIAKIISRPGVRVDCDACDEEIINERELIFDDQILCRTCAGYGYYIPAINHGELDLVYKKQYVLSLSKNG